MANKKQRKNNNLAEKVMLGLNPDMIARARDLIPAQAKRALSGSATLSSVLRAAIAEGLDVLEKDAIDLK
jgi:hypothetical protein